MNEKDLLVYGTIGVFGIGAILLIDAYAKGVQEYIPLMLEAKR